MNELIGLTTSREALTSFGMALLVFGFAPGFVLRLIVKFYPRDDPRRAELLAELYAVRRRSRPMWVAEQIETALWEGPAARALARKRRPRSKGFWTKLKANMTPRMRPGIGPMRPLDGGLPIGKEWAYEFIWPGLRCHVQASGGTLRLLTDSGRDVTSSFPELGVLAAHGGRGLVLDGVVVARDPVAGRPDPALLRRRHQVARPSEMLQAQTPVSLFVLDVLEVDGRSTVRLPYHARRLLLTKLEFSGNAVVVPPSFNGVAADAVLRTARRYGLDGVLAKRVESTYQPGRRSSNWVSLWIRPPRSGDAEIN